jgi:hypothetical protein
VLALCCLQNGRSSRSRGAGPEPAVLRADSDTAADAPGDGRAGPLPCPAWSAEDRAGQVRDQPAGQETTSWPSPQPGTRTVPVRHRAATRTSTLLHAEIDQPRLAASRLAASGRQVSRRALRSEGIRDSNQALNALARKINSELADSTRGQP